MKRREFIRSLIIASSVTTVSVAVPATARIGRPASPNSVAGVRRRTRRRHRRRIRRHQVLYSLPYGCSLVKYRGGTKYYYCRGIWYRPTYQGTTIVYVVDEIEPGADTDVEFLD